MDNSTPGLAIYYGGVTHPVESEPRSRLDSGLRLGAILVLLLAMIPFVH